MINFINTGADEATLKSMSTDGCSEELIKAMNKQGLVQKDVTVQGKNGKTFTRKQWVKASDAKSSASISQQGNSSDGFDDVKRYYGIKGTETVQELRQIRSKAYTEMDKVFKQYQSALRSNKSDASTLGISAGGKQKYLGKLDEYIKFMETKSSDGTSGSDDTSKKQWVKLDPNNKEHASSKDAYCMVSTINKRTRKVSHHKIEGSVGKIQSYIAQKRKDGTLYDFGNIYVSQSKTSGQTNSKDPNMGKTLDIGSGRKATVKSYDKLSQHEQREGADRLVDIAGQRYDYYANVMSNGVGSLVPHQDDPKIDMSASQFNVGDKGMITLNSGTISVKVLDKATLNHKLMYLVQEDRPLAGGASMKKYWVADYNVKPAPGSKSSKKSTDNPVSQSASSSKKTLDLAHFDSIKSDKAEALKYLKDCGITWTENSHAGINWMRAMAAYKAATGNQNSTQVVAKTSAQPNSQPAPQTAQSAQNSQPISSKMSKEDAKKKTQSYTSKVGKSEAERKAFMGKVKAQGITWKDKADDGSDVAPAVNWMRCCMAMNKHFAEGGSFDDSDKSGATPAAAVSGGKLGTKQDREDFLRAVIKSPIDDEVTKTLKKLADGFDPNIDSGSWIQPDHVLNINIDAAQFKSQQYDLSAKDGNAFKKLISDKLKEMGFEVNQMGKKKSADGVSFWFDLNSGNDDSNQGGGK